MVIMKTKITTLFIGLIALLALGSCSDDNVSDLQLNGLCSVDTVALDTYAGTVDQTTRTITVRVPETYDISDMTVSRLGLSSGGLRGGGRLRSRRGGGDGLHLRGGLGDPVRLGDGDLLTGSQGLAGVGGEDANPGGHAGSLDGARGGDLGVAGGVGSRSDHGQGEAGRSGDSQTAACGGSKVIQWGKGAGGFAVTCGGA